MQKPNANSSILRPRWQWYISGVIVLVGTLLLFTFIVYIQATAAFLEGASSLEDFQRSFAERVIKVLMLVLTMGIFLFFFEVQDYRITFSSLLEKLSFNQNTSQDSVFDTAGSDEQESLTKSSDHSNDLTLIESSIDSMLKENQNYRDRLDRQRTEQKSDYLLRLMKGWINETPVARRVFHSYGFGSLDSDFIVVVTGLSSVENSKRLHETSISMAFLIMQQLLDQMLKHLFYVHSVTVDNKLAFLLIPEPTESLNDQQTLSDLITAIKLSQHMVFDEIRITLRSALGTIDNELPGLHRSFSAATDSFEYSHLLGDDCAVALMRDSAEQEDELVSSTWSKLEHQFINCIETEEYRRAHEHFEGMLNCGYIKWAPTLELARHRMLSLTNVLIDAVEKAGTAVHWSDDELQTFHNKILTSQSLTKLQSTAAEIFAALDFRSSARHRQSSYLRTIDIIDHVEAHYADPNLNVNQIAATFELNPSYLSRNFKRLMCIGLSDYIRHTRILKAKELLSDSAVSVKHVAEAVGFSNVLAMNRAFRKEEGTTAGLLRKSLPASE